MAATTLADLIKEVSMRFKAYRRVTATGGSATARSIVVSTGLIEPDNTFVNLYAYVLTDAGLLGAAPEGEERLITAYDRANARLTVAPAFTVAVVADDIVEILPERRDRLEVAINAAIGAAGERWSVVARDTTSLVVIANTYEYNLATNLSAMTRFLSLWTRGSTSEAWREIPAANYRITGTPAAEYLLFDTLEGLDAGDLLMVEYRTLPSALATDAGTLGVGEVAESGLVRFITEYALGWLHQAAASATPQDFREHWSLSKRHYDEAEKLRKSGGGRRRSGRVRYRKPPRARG